MLPNRAIIIGSGSSIKEVQSSLPSALEKECTFVINWGYHDFPATVNTFVDYEFYNQEKAELDKLGLVIGRDDPKLSKVFPVGDNVSLLSGAGRYFGKQSWNNGFYSGALSGLFTLTVAIALGFQEIYLLGYDFCEINGLTHYYQGDGRNLGIKKVPAGEPGHFRNVTGVGKEPSDPTIYCTGCYNSDPSLLFDAYHPTKFLEIDLDEGTWKELLNEIKGQEPEDELYEWLVQYLDYMRLMSFKKVPLRLKEKEDYIQFIDYKRIMVKIINRMILDLGIAKVTEIFWPYLCSFYGLKKELSPIEIINVSLKSKIETFPKIGYKNFLEHLKYYPANVNQEEAREEIKKIIKENKCISS